MKISLLALCVVGTLGAAAAFGQDAVPGGSAEAVRVAMPAKDAVSAEAAAAPHDSAQNKMEASFQSFCADWMLKLQAREIWNVDNIKWQSDAAKVQGDYVGYSQEHTCILKNGTHAVPVGTIRYNEVRYEKEGPTAEEAVHSRPRAVEATDVTEIFRFENGKWVY